MLLLTCCYVVVFAQNMEDQVMIYLLDGSFLKGSRPEEAGEGKVKIHLLAGGEVILPKEQVWKVVENGKDQLLLPDGRRVSRKGGYFSLSIHTLSAQQVFNSGKDFRWGLGAHFSRGYQFRPWLMIGAGIGVDAHEYALAPIFAEVRGYLVSDRPGDLRPNSGWVWNVKEQSAYKRRIPFTYGLQWGFNLPLHEILTQKDFESIQGGRLFYPWAGFLFPSRNGAAFQLDIGYKFQRFKRIIHSPWGGGEQIDEMRLRSFAMRAGWFF